MKLLKRGAALALCLIMCVTLVPVAAHADGVAVNASNFPDEVFRNYVSNWFDKDENGTLSSAEIAAATSIELTESGLTDLKGVERFTELTYLNCTNNSLTSLDVTHNTKLTDLSCSKNSLTALDVTKNTVLSSLDCSGNSLSGLNVTKNTALRYLACGNNQLTYLDVTKNAALSYLECGKNRLTSLDVTKNTVLSSLDCSGNSLSGLNVTKNTALRRLDCERCGLTSLNLANNTQLDGLYCGYNKMTSVSIGALTELTSLSLEGSPIGSLDVSALTKLEYLNLSGTALKNFTLPFYVQTFRFYGNPGCRLTLMSTGPYSNGWTNDIGTEYVNGEVYYEYHMVTGGGGQWRLGIDSPISLKGRTPPSISVQPKDVFGNSGTVTLNVTASGTGELHYQWYTYMRSLNGGWFWTEAFEGCSPTLTIDANEDNDGQLYFCRISDDNGRVCSKVVRFSYYEAPSIIFRTRKISAAVGTTVTFSVEATGGDLQYQWYYRKPGETEWRQVQAASGKTPAYTLTVEERHNGYKYKCRVWNALGETTSDPALLEVFTVPAVITQPTNATVAVGKTATFKVTASGGELSYQWYYMKPETGEWKPVSNNGTSATYKLTTEARHDGYKYRCKISNSHGEIFSDIVLLTVVTAKPTITMQPKNVTVAAGKTATFKVVAEGAGIDFLWLYCKPGETGWNEVTAAGGKTAVYTLTAAARHNGYQYRCRVRNAKGIVYTNTVTLTVGNGPTITTQPTDKTVNEGKTATFKVVATGATSYQWQYLKPGESTWRDVSNNGTSASYKLTTEARHNGFNYRCKVSNTTGSVISNVVLLVVNAKPVITTQPKNVTVTAGKTASFYITADGATPLSYQWWYLKPGTSEWKPAANNGTSASYKLTTEARHNGYKYKCVVTNIAGEATSAIVTLKVN